MALPLVVPVVTAVAEAGFFESIVLALGALFTTPVLVGGALLVLVGGVVYAIKNINPNPGAV